ncbi:CCDC174 family protein [Gaetbulibacter aestuarii]|uniref:Uncharacterized protein n=1 Tax=Gaetbulibacter aestuarii TaxID=1502358 RepID=A0ABW7N191_9FLAO
MSHDIHAKRKDKPKENVSIKVENINVEDALYLLRLLNFEDKSTLHRRFRGLLYFPFSKDDELRKKQFEAVPYLIKLMDLCDKFNQRDGWWLDDQSPIEHNRRPHNNVPTKLIVQKGEIKIVNRKDYTGTFLLEFIESGKYKGNAECFVKSYKDDILKAGILLNPIHWNVKETKELRNNYNLKRVMI